MCPLLCIFLPFFLLYYLFISSTILSSTSFSVPLSMSFFLSYFVILRLSSHLFCFSSLLYFFLHSSLHVFLLIMFRPFSPFLLSFPLLSSSVPLSYLIILCSFIHSSPRYLTPLFISLFLLPIPLSPFYVSSLLYFLNSSSLPSTPISILPHFPPLSTIFHSSSFLCSSTHSSLLI